MFASPARIPIHILQIITECINQIQASHTYKIPQMYATVNTNNKENTIPGILINNKTK
jgi:hypothetical protein